MVGINPQSIGSDHAYEDQDLGLWGCFLRPAEFESNTVVVLKPLQVGRFHLPAGQRFGGSRPMGVQRGDGHGAVGRNDLAGRSAWFEPDLDSVRCGPPVLFVRGGTFWFECERGDRFATSRIACMVWRFVAERGDRVLGLGGDFGRYRFRGFYPGRGIFLFQIDDLKGVIGRGGLGWPMSAQRWQVDLRGPQIAILITRVP